MAAGPAGLPGEPAWEVKREGPEDAKTPPPGMASTASESGRKRSLVRTQTSGTYSKFMHTTCGKRGVSQIYDPKANP